MKQLLAVLLTGCRCVVSARGSIVYDYSSPTSFGIPDGNLSGVSSSVAVSGAVGNVADITVTLNVSGGYNGDMYAYLSYNGTAVTLLNRVGVGAGNAFGYSDAGFNVTLGSTGTDVHLYGANSPTIVGGQLTGTWQVDGRAISPLSSPASFSSQSTLDGRSTFDAYDGMNPNGTWTIFFADTSGGGGAATLNSWSLSITEVPEPTDIALITFAAMFGGTLGLRHLRQTYLKRS